MSGYKITKGDDRFLPITITRENAISRGRYIRNIEYRKTDKAEWLNVEIIDNEGNVARKSYFPPILGSLYVPDKEKLKKEQEAFTRAMSHITKLFLGTDYEVEGVETFAQFCNKIIEDLGKTYHGKELRMKLVYDSKNKPTLPKFPVFIEDPELVSDLNTRMKLTDFDKVVQVAVVMDSDTKDIPNTTKVITAKDMLDMPDKADSDPVGEDGLPF